MQVDFIKPPDTTPTLYLEEAPQRRDMSLAELAGQLESRQDEFWRTALPAARQLLNELHLWLSAGSSASDCTGILQARSEFSQFEIGLRRHLDMEEAILYPLCGYVGQDGLALASAEPLLHSLLREHELITAKLRQALTHLHLMTGPAEYLPAWFKLLDALNYMALVWAEHRESQEKLILPRLRAASRSLNTTPEAQAIPIGHSAASLAVGC